MQVDASPESIAAVKILEDTGECTFGVFLGPRIRPVFFVSRSHQPYEEHYYSFVGEVACRRWVINYCRK